MSLKLILAIITITLALIFYTIGVFSERKEKILRKKHVIFFGLGLICDTTGTTIMSKIAENTTTQTSGLGLHQITGGAALILMLAHFLWALYVLWRGSAHAKTAFHKFSIVVWGFWLIPYIAGLVIGMGNAG